MPVFRSQTRVVVKTLIIPRKLYSPEAKRRVWCMGRCRIRQISKRVPVEFFYIAAWIDKEYLGKPIVGERQCQK